MESKLLRTLTVLTILLSISLAIVSFFGAFDPFTYERDSETMAVQGMGQDMVDLFLVVPLLLVSLIFTRKGNRAWTLIYGGALFYIMYSFVIYAFGVNFNRFFLLYCATLGLSLYAFIIFLHALSGLNIKGWFKSPPPVRITSIFLLFIAAIFYVVWLKDIIPALVSGTVPSALSEAKLLVNPVHVVDLAFALPGLVLTALLLIRRRNYGFILAPVALVFSMILAIALVAMAIMLKANGIIEDISVAFIFGGLHVFSLILLVLFLRKLNEKMSGL